MSLSHFTVHRPPASRIKALSLPRRSCRPWPLPLLLPAQSAAAPWLAPHGCSVQPHPPRPSEPLVPENQGNEPRRAQPFRHGQRGRRKRDAGQRWARAGVGKWAQGANRRRVPRTLGCSDDLQGADLCPGAVRCFLSLDSKVPSRLSVLTPSRSLAVGLCCCSLRLQCPVCSQGCRRLRCLDTLLGSKGRLRIRAAWKARPSLLSNAGESLRAAKGEGGVFKAPTCNAAFSSSSSRWILWTAACSMGHGAAVGRERAGGRAEEAGNRAV